MNITAKLTEAQIVRVAIVDDDLSKRITSADLQIENPHAAAALNDRADPDRVAYVDLLRREGHNPDGLDDLAEPLAEEAIRNQAPARLRAAAEAVLAARTDRAEPVLRVIALLKELGITEANIHTYPTPRLPHDAIYDLMIVDYFLVDTMTDATLPFIREVLDTHHEEDLPLQVILMSSHETRLKHDFKSIRPELKISSSRMRIMEKPRTDTHLVAWRAALWQLASDRGDVVKLERFIEQTGTALTASATATASRLWELDLQAMDLLHELASKDNDDYVRYVEDAVSRRLLSSLELDGGMRPALQQLDEVLAAHRTANLLSPTAEIGDSRAAIHGLMHSMEWREGAPVLPAYPAGADSLEQACWLQRNIRFGMVLRDPQGGEWLNITQACDLAQAKEADFGSSTVLFVRGQHTLPSVTLDGNYYVSMSAMMAHSENHVLTWNLRDVRAESIQAFGVTYGTGWQVVGELRPDRAQDIAAQYGARMARVGLPVTLSAWRLVGCAVRAGNLAAAVETDALEGLALDGHAIQRPKAKTHELHLDLASVDALLTTHGGVLDAAVVALLTGMAIKPGSKQDVGGRAVCVYRAAAPSSVADARSGLEPLLQDTRNAEKILVLVWSAP
ncbi:MAG: hypothetical protein NVV68_09115 [Dokdonella sp.]|nr:hypothetical protein [Dokdonella sp.]